MNHSSVTEFVLSASEQLLADIQRSVCSAVSGVQRRRRRHLLILQILSSDDADRRHMAWFSLTGTDCANQSWIEYIDKHDLRFTAGATRLIMHVGTYSADSVTEAEMLYDAYLAFSLIHRDFRDISCRLGF